MHLPNQHHHQTLVALLEHSSEPWGIDSHAGSRKVGREILGCALPPGPRGRPPQDGWSGLRSWQQVALNSKGRLALRLLCGEAGDMDVQLPTNPPMIDASTAASLSSLPAPQHVATPSRRKRTGISRASSWVLAHNTPRPRPLPPPLKPLAQPLYPSHPTRTCRIHLPHHPPLPPPLITSMSRPDPSRPNLASPIGPLWPYSP